MSRATRDLDSITPNVIMYELDSGNLVESVTETPNETYIGFYTNIETTALSGGNDTTGDLLSALDSLASMFAGGASYSYFKINANTSAEPNIPADTLYGITYDNGSNDQFYEILDIGQSGYYEYYYSRFTYKPYLIEVTLSADNEITLNFEGTLNSINTIENSNFTLSGSYSGSISSSTFNGNTNCFNS